MNNRPKRAFGICVFINNNSIEGLYVDGHLKEIQKQQKTHQ